MIDSYIESSGSGFTHLHPNTFMQNILRFSLHQGGVIRQYIGEARVGWVDTDDIARVAAAVLRAPGRHQGKTYPLAFEARSVAEVASVLTEVVGRPFRYEPRSPDEWLASALAGGMEPTYAHCVHNVFRRTADGSLREAAQVFDSGAGFQAITGRRPMSWRDHAEKHRSEFLRAFAEGGN
jgi:NAD(P)H dehydrogenase (quinone)